MRTTRRLLPGAPGVPPAAPSRFHETPPRPAPWMLHSRRLPAGPLHWAIFQPNARGRGELTSLDGMGERQLLKAAGQYLGERVLVAVGVDEVAIWPILGRRLVLACAGRWPIDRLLAVPVAPPDGAAADLPAAALVDIGAGRFVAELRAAGRSSAADLVYARSVITALG